MSDLLQTLIKAKYASASTLAAVGSFLSLTKDNMSDETNAQIETFTLEWLRSQRSDAGDAVIAKLLKWSFE